MKKRGFTLIELIASLAIISLLVLVGSQILSLSLDVSRKSYEDELAYKEATYGMLYIENIIRSAYKIEVDESYPDSNFKVYLRKDKNDDVTSHRFCILRAKDGNNYLTDNTNNISKSSDKDGDMRISKIETLYLNYDQKDKTVHIILNHDSQKNRIESFIYLGNRL